MIEPTKLFCSQTDRALSDLTIPEQEKLQFCVFCAVGEEMGFNLAKLTKAQSDKIESVCSEGQWIHQAINHDILYIQSDELEIIFNPEVDHYDLEGNFVKGIPND